MAEIIKKKRVKPYGTYKISIEDLNPILLEKIRRETGNIIVGLTIPKFNLDIFERIKGNQNMCEFMYFVNSLNVSGVCGKIKDVRFPWEPQVGNEFLEFEYYNYDPNCYTCGKSSCPGIIRDECVKKSEEKVKPKVIKKKKILK